MPALLSLSSLSGSVCVSVSVSVSLSVSGDLKQVAQAVAGIDLQDSLVEMIFTLFDENSSVNNSIFTMHS